MEKVYIIRDEEYLEHHGIKGQKWGIRRYQNEDGSLTKEGMLRYAKYYKEEQEEKISKELFEPDGDPKDWKDHESRNVALERALDKLDKKRKENDRNYRQMVSDIKSGKDISDKIVNKEAFLKKLKKNDIKEAQYKKEVGKKVLIGLGITSAVAATVAGAAFLKKKGEDLLAMGGVLGAAYVMAKLSECS